jgi:hypothetical protein
MRSLNVEVPILAYPVSRYLVDTSKIHGSVNQLVVRETASVMIHSAAINQAFRPKEVLFQWH